MTSETRRLIELEEQRLAALHAYAVLDTPPEQDFDGMGLSQTSRIAR